MNPITKMLYIKISFYCDYSYISPDTKRYVIRGGRLPFGLNCGAFCIDIDFVHNAGAMGVGACLSFKQILL